VILIILVILFGLAFVGAVLKYFQLSKNIGRTRIHYVASSLVTVSRNCPFY
jgi:hypothetical protein